MPSYNDLLLFNSLSVRITKETQTHLNKNHQTFTMNKNTPLDINLWRKLKSNGNSKRQRRSVKAQMLLAVGPRINKASELVDTENVQFEHLENMDAENVAVVENNSGPEPMIVTNESESNWPIELDDDFINSSAVEVVDDRNLIFSQDLANWSLKHAIRRDAIDELLGILNEVNPEMKLPKHARTILKTPIEKQDIAEDGFGGQYWHYGLEKGLVTCLQNMDYSPIVQLNVNIDGLPLFESSKMEFWPILFNIHGKSNVPPIVVGIFAGKGEYCKLIH